MALLVGTSLGRCLKDILDTKVQESEILVIVTSTNASTLEHIQDVVEEYYYTRNVPKGYDLSEYSLLQCKELVSRLFNAGKIHQPRAYTNDFRGHKLKDNWYDIVPTLTSSNASVVDAYEKYRMLEILVS